ncbi:peptidoglycan DD-metalloendopeptidase family protein [bacterium]|nr:peptidoglycan DD-metalloendopeptidase family protein [bacterium]
MPAWAQVTSKWNQPRTIGTNPHQGVDLHCVKDTSVKAVWDGWLIKIDYNTAMLQIDVNSDKIKNDPVYYCKYDHLESVASENYYEIGKEIGKSGIGGSGPHLHFGAISAQGKWFKNTDNYDYQDEWNHGKDLDSFSNRSWYQGTICGITAYFKDENGVYSPKK